MPVARLAAKLDEYARYRDMRAGANRAGARGGEPAWRRRYSRFPRLMVVLDGAGAGALERRMYDLAAAVSAGSGLHGARLAAGVTTLARLSEHGPFAPVFVPLGHGTGDDLRSDALLGGGSGEA